MNFCIGFIPNGTQLIASFIIFTTTGITLFSASPPTRAHSLLCWDKGVATPTGRLRVWVARDFKSRLYQLLCVIYSGSLQELH